MEEARAVYLRVINESQKTIMRVHKAVHSYVHKEWNKRFCQLYTAAHVRLRSITRARITFVRVYRCMRMRSYSSGRASRVTYVTFASVGRLCYSICVSCVCVRASLTPTRYMCGCRQPQSRGYFAEGSSSVQVESWGLLVLSTLWIPQLSLSLSLPSSLPFFAFSRLPRLGSKAKASPLLHLRRERPCNSNERPSLFPFILVPVSGER